LPIGAVTLIIIAFILKAPAPANSGRTVREKIEKLDPVGTFFFIPGVVCLLLALQWGGSTYAWNSGRIVALLVLFGVLMIAFIGVQILKQENATVPPRIVRNRSIAAGLLYSTCVGAGMMLMVYYIPIWFQAIKVRPAAAPKLILKC